MNADYLISLIAVSVLGVIVYVGAGATAGLQTVFGVWIPYAAIILFILGFARRILVWAKSPVPFRIPTTCGQQESLPWIKSSKIDCPTTTTGVVLRMLFEILTFRSLFRNTRAEINANGRISYKWVLWLWLFALMFHYCFLVVVLRHLRFFTQPVPQAIVGLETLDGMLQVGLPVVRISGILLLLSVLALLARRILLPKVNYISRQADYFPLILITGIATTGILMRYFFRVDIVKVKELAMSLVTLHPAIPAGGLSGLFYVHLFFVSILLAYIPFSKLMHMGGVFLSPTRNLANNSRAKRHINPWNPDVKVHTYDEYEDDFRDKMIEAGLPVEKE